MVRGFGHWALEELETGELVGRTGLYYPPDWPGIEVGWTVARDHWGKGYAPEAARAACAWGHDRLGVNHIVSLIHPDNAQSIRVAEKLGETLEGRHSTRGFDLLVYGVDLPLVGALTRGYISGMTMNEDSPDRQRSRRKSCCAMRRRRRPPRPAASAGRRPSTRTRRTFPPSEA